LFKDMELGLPMMKRGKVEMLPHKIKGSDEVKQIFDRVAKMGGE
jgi:heterodisulfide reductase subunit C